jgi:hypothetical protein
MTFLYILVAAITLFWLLHTLYIAVMALRDRRDDFSLSTLDKLLGYPTLVIGLVVDAVVNITIMTVLLMELPQLQRGELLVTPRIRRLAGLPANSTGLARWRRLVSRWMLSEIDQHDKSGGHNVPKEKE